MVIDVLNVKICCTCKEIKKITEFFNNKNKKNGKSSDCKKCNYKRSRKWLATHKGKVLMQSLHKKRREALKKIIFEKLGNKCINCNFSDTRALHIDHIDGGGSRERKTLNWSPFYMQLSKGIGIEKVQLLCANCNWIKIYENKERASQYE